MGFLALGYAYVWLRLGPSVEYGSAGVPFFLSRSFFGQYAALPGGLLDYAAAFLAQLNYYDWLGSLVFAVLGCLLFLGARAVFWRLNGLAPLSGGFVPVFLLLWLRGRSDGHALAAGVGSSLALWLAAGHMGLPCRCAWLRLAACWLAAALMAWATGLWPCLLFLALACGFELAAGSRIVALGSLLAAVAGPLAMIALAGLPAWRVLNPWGTGTSLWLTAALFLCVPLTASVLALLPKPPPAPAQSVTRKGRHKAAAPVPFRRRLLQPGVKRAFAIGLFLAGWTAVWLGHSNWQRAFERIDYYAARKQFDKVLAVAAPLPALDAASAVRLQLALYHAGRLTQDLFAFPNHLAWRLLPGLDFELPACRAQCDTLMELGQVNEAEHLAHEALELEGNRPNLLRLLARVNILKNRPQAAAVFLNLLAQAPFQRAWAAARLRNLDYDPRLPDDRELALIRTRMVTTDLPHDRVPVESFLQQLLQSNPRNQMAFEYLLAHYLVTRNLDRLIKQLGRLDDFGYTGIPRHLEEALLLYQQTRGGPVELHGRQVRPETVQRFARFTQALNRARQNPEERHALELEFKDTFWLYFYTRPMENQ